jgi:hypothetical protein
VPDTLRALAATVVVFAVGGFGLVRLLLPRALRAYELLWVLPTGGCAVGLALTLLGFAHLPYAVSMVVVGVAGAGLAVYAVRRNGIPELDLARLRGPVLVAALVTYVALVPMILHQHYAAPVGTGSDAHVAAGTAQLLRHAGPTGTDIAQPINRMPPTWQSKYPIYYAFAAVATVSGLATWQVLAILAAALLGMAATGFFLVARDVFGVPSDWSLAAGTLAGCNREALHTILNPYFNQTWGFFALPFTLVLGWWLVQPGLGRRARGATAGLLAVFALVLVFAYPLAAPIPAVPIAVFVLMEWRRKLRAGEPTLHPRDLYRGRISLLWLIPVCALLAVPAIGVGQKVVSAIQVLAPGHSLQSWGGDLPGFIPFNYFVSLPSPLWLLPFTVLLFGLAALGLRRAPRSLAWGLGGLLAIGVLLAVYLRHRQFGFYFHFKLLAFIGPVVVVIAAVGASTLRRRGALLLAVFGVATAGSAVAELAATGYQLPQATIELRSWAAALPSGTSIRMDMWPPLQLWAGYFLDGRPLCSQLPLLNTDYPHVPVSRKADYIVATLDAGRPRDAVGPALRQNDGYRLYRENPSVPGPAACSQRRLDRIYTGIGFSPQ